MTGDSFSPGEEHRGNTELSSKAQVITFQWSPFVAFSVLNKPVVKSVHSCNQLGHSRTFILS